MSLSFAFFGAALAVWFLAFPVIRWLRSRQVLDRPNERSSHVVPTPRGGGLALVLVLIPGFIILYLTSREPFALLLAVGSVLLAGISFLDDLRPLRPAIRFSIHLAAALLLVAGMAFWNPGREVASVAFQGGLVIPGWLIGSLLCLYLVGYTNAFNFMDGINGISGMQAIISGSGVAIMAVLVDQAELHSIALAAALVAGSAVGFLPHNFPRARVFMGDVGSVPIGFVTAGLGVVFAFKAGFWLLLPLVLLHSNYILDTSITLLRRIARGEKWYLPHREHFYQRLIRSGFSHSFVTFSEGCLQLATMGGAIACLYLTPSLQALVAAGVILLWLSFFAWAELRFRDSVSKNPPGSTSSPNSPPAKMVSKLAPDATN
jgi:UDP-N-acetylmuramyl pentapeptide phosphotransferase/UDP-N-acetylglucosamine-1-phosphate transferase